MSAGEADDPHGPRSRAHAIGDGGSRLGFIALSAALNLVALSAATPIVDFLDDLWIASG
jgi:hypothetical protein